MKVTHAHRKNKKERRAFMTHPIRSARSSKFCLEMARGDRRRELSPGIHNVGDFF